MALFPGLPGWTGTRKVKPIWILLKQETVSGSGISWAICKSAPRSRQITMPVPHHSVFLQAGCSSCRPTNSVEALKAITVAYAFLSIYEKNPLVSAKPAVTLATLKRAVVSFAAWWTEARWVWTVCLRLLPDSVATAIWTRLLHRMSPAR